nr:MAG TPA: hypothetical protein [Caudoviricetes sp.]
MSLRLYYLYHCGSFSRVFLSDKNVRKTDRTLLR